MMRPKTFLLTSLIFFMALGAVYYLALANSLYRPQSVPFLYGQFLLEASADVSGKLVIDSGSNGRHGIDAAAIHQALGVPTIIASDVASTPLRKKYFRLNPVLQAGDTLLLPLEWDYFSRSAVLVDAFLKDVDDENRRFAHYVVDLPLDEKLRFAFREYPFTYALQTIFNSLLLGREDPNPAYRFAKFDAEHALNNNLSLGGAERDGPEKPHYAAALSKSCDHYMLFRDEKMQLSVSPTFRENLKLLKKLSDRGVRVLLAWPAVVDSKRSTCFTEPEVVAGLDAFVEEIEQLAAANGLTVLGDYRDNHYPAECYLNTHYHLRWSCAPRRTEPLIGLLAELGVGANESSLKAQEFRDHVGDYLTTQRKKVLQKP